MVDKKSLKIDSDEYRLNEDEEETHDYSVENASGDDINKLKSWRSKRLLMPIVLVVSVVLIYQFLSWYSNRKVESGAKQEEIAAQAQKSTKSLAAYQQNDLEAADESAGVPKKAGAGAVSNLAAGDVDTMSTQQKLDILAVRTGSNTGQLLKLKDNVAQVDATLGSLNQNVSALSKSVQELSGNVQTLVQTQKEKANQAEKTAKARTKAVKKSLVHRNIAPRILYHLKAIVPGLAWLEGSDGRTMAVRVGDKLEGYGIVSLIEVKQGMVITSGGSVIQYGMNDF